MRFSRAGVGFDVIADFIDAAVEEIRRGDVELPEIFGLPWSQRVGRDGLDVRIRQQGQHFELGLRCRFFRQRRGRFPGRRYRGAS